MHVAFANAQVKTRIPFTSLSTSLFTRSSLVARSLSLSLFLVAVDKKKGMRASLSHIDLIDFEHVFLRQQKKRN